jgi:ABC-type spermidine/putrescine transport system permease subunit II
VRVSHCITPSMCHLASVLQHTTHVGLTHHVYLCFQAMLVQAVAADLCSCWLWFQRAAVRYNKTVILGCHCLHVPDVLLGLALACMYLASGCCVESFWQVILFCKLGTGLAQWNVAARVACRTSRQDARARMDHAYVSYHASYVGCNECTWSCL